MDFFGSIGLTLQYMEIIAWSSFALLYPLGASIQAMESKSHKETRKLMAYWIIFSLLMLVEIALGNIVRLIIPLWSCIKLLAVCWFVLPHFERADIFYCNQIEPFLSELRTSIIHYLCKPMEEIILTEECFLALVEKFVDLNGSEALEELVARKLSVVQKKHNVGDLKAKQKEEKGNIIIGPVVQVREKCVYLNGSEALEELVARKSSLLQKKPSVEDLKAEEQKEECKGNIIIEPVIQPDAKDKENVKPERNIEQAENVTTIQVALQKKPDVEAEQKEESKGSIEPMVQVVDNLMDDELQPTKVEADGIGTGTSVWKVVDNLMDDELQPAKVEAQPPKLTAKKDIKEKKCSVNNSITCTICQVTVNEKIMPSHLRGKKHMANLKKQIINFAV